MPDQRYEDERIEALIRGTMAVVHDKVEDRYFQVNTDGLSGHIPDGAKPAITRISTPVALGVLFTGIALLLGNVAYSFLAPSEATAGFFLWFVPYILASLVLHESAHLIVLRLLGRRHDKVGFKLHYWILPAFYVRMNQSVLLSRNEKVVVHGAGIWINLTINALLILLNAWIIKSPDLNVALTLAIVTLAANALPVLNSDGYRVLLALADVNELKDWRRNPAWIVRIKVLSWMLMFAYGLYITIDTYLGVIHA